MSDRPAHSRLRLVAGAAPAAPERAFCSHCGGTPPDDQGDVRVCGRCSLGLLLRAPADVAPAAADPFLVVDRRLAVCAVSGRAEHLLGTTELQAVETHLGDVLVAAELGAPGRQLISEAVLAAVDGRADPVHVVVRPPGVFGVRYWARIGPCGPPTAALLVLADAR